MTNDALVLAGGGVAGIAWEIGVLHGLEEAEPAAAAPVLDEGTVLVGTSAGSVVAAQIGGGTSLAALFEAQLAPESAELSVEFDAAAFMATMAAALDGAASAQEGRQRLGRLAREASTVPFDKRRGIIEARLPRHGWPSRRVLITSVDTESGELRVFDGDSGVPLIDAVAASCAVPGVWPTVEINGRHYMDGGTRSLANADLAAGAERVLILVPAPATLPHGPALAQFELEALAPARIHMVFADSDSIAAFGSNPLAPEVRRPAALAGRALGHRIAADVAAFWG